MSGSSGEARLERPALRILVDTNVWLDYFLGERAGSADALAFLRTARAAGASLLYPASSATDLFYIICAELKRAVARERGAVGETDALAIREIAWSCLGTLRELACAVGMDESDVWLATKFRALTDDFEDGVVLAAAQRAQADYLVTGDTALIAKANVAALAPRDMLAVLELGRP